jgi:hypothetical protein
MLFCFYFVGFSIIGQTDFLSINKTQDIGRKCYQIVYILIFIPFVLFGQRAHAAGFFLVKLFFFIHV